MLPITLRRPRRKAAGVTVSADLARAGEGPHRAKGYCVKHYNQARWQRIKRQLERIKELEARAELL